MRFLPCAFASLYVLSLSIFPNLVFAAGAREKTSASGSGSIKLDTVFKDFGSVKRGELLTAKFSYTNSGNGPLIIQGVQASCDCTTVETAKGKSLAPGEAGVIEVVFDTTDYSGRVTKAITVITNEKPMPDRTLTVSALVNSEITADPPLVDFGDVVINQTPQQVVHIKGTMKNELKIDKLRYNEEALDIGYKKEGKDWILHVKLKPTVGIGFLKDTIYVKNNSSALPEMPIPVRATIKGPIAYSPGYIEFGSVAAKDKSSRQLDLTAVESFDITANRIELMVNGTKLESAEKFLKVSVIPADKNSKKISVELVNPGNNPGSVHGKLFLDTNNPQQKTLTIDFYAFFR